MKNIFKSNQKIQSLSLKFFIYLSAFFSTVVIAGIILFVLIKGIPNLKLDLFSVKYTSENASLFPALINTFTITILSLLLAVPIGVFGAIYLVEYASKKSKIVSVIRMTTETLAGIPSIVFGLFGFLLFVSKLKWQFSILSGCFTLAIMILPTIIRTTEESLISVSDSYREASFGLGAGKLRTIFKIVLPSAFPGILNGIVLSIGRIIGETAALIYTAGTIAQIPKSVMGSGRTLAVHLYSLWCEGLNTNQAYATAVILLLFAFALNCISLIVEKYIAKKQVA